MTDPVEPGSLQSSRQHSWTPSTPGALGSMCSHPDISAGILQPWSLEWRGTPSATLPANTNASVSEVIRTHIDKRNFAGGISWRCCDECLVVAVNPIFVCRAASVTAWSILQRPCRINFRFFYAFAAVIANFPTSVWVESLSVLALGFWFNRGYVDGVSFHASCNFHFLAGESARLLSP